MGYNAYNSSVLCKKCGFENDSDAIFCEKCGANLKEVKFTEKTINEKKPRKNKKLALTLSIVIPVVLIGIIFGILGGTDALMKKSTAAYDYEEYNQETTAAAETTATATTPAAVETTSAATTVNEEIIGTVGNAVWKQVLIYSEDFNNNEGTGWVSEYSGSSIIDNMLFMSGKDIENDGRYRDFVSYNGITLHASQMYHWQIKVKLSSDSPKDGTGLNMTLFNFDKNPIALLLDRNSIRGDDNIFVAKAGGKEWRDNTIVSTGIKPELDKWYMVDIYYTFAPDVYWSVSVNGEVKGVKGTSEIYYAGTDGQENATGIKFGNENSVYIDYIKIYNVWKDYKEEE